jgi:hypothetical protein
MKLKTIICILTFFGLTTNVYSQIDSLELKEGIDYDARLFLTETQVHSFNKIYTDFDSVKVVKNWEWKDVDPLGFFSPEENRAKRRELFLFEQNPFLIGEEKPNVEKLAYKLLIERRIEDSKILIDNSTVKIIFPYTSLYENFKFKGIYNLLEKISELGLEWAQTGGLNLYIYNGNILLGKYKSGYVSLACLNIDKPNKKYLKNQRKLNSTKPIKKK